MSMDESLSQSISSVEDSPARISVQPESLPESTESEADCGLSMRDCFGTFDPDSYSLRTFQGCLLTNQCEEYSAIFPSSGTMRSGRLFLHAPWVNHTCDEGCSLWPTPTASMDGRGFGISNNEASGRYRLSIILRVLALTKEHGWRIHPNFTEALMGFPMGWTEIEQSETPSTLIALSGSDEK